MFDASALLCFLQGEAGADVVERELANDATCSAVNWSEVAQKVIAHDADWELASSLLLSFGLRIEPVVRADAERAANLWRRGSGRSIADRICLATALRLEAHIWTADTAWGASDRISQVR